MLIGLPLWATATAAAPAQPAKVAKPYTYHDVARQYTTFWVDVIVGGYQQQGHKDAKWDAAVLAFLDAFARRFAVEGLPAFYWPDGILTRLDLAKLAIATDEKGCDDPMVRTAAYLAYHKYWTPRPHTLPIAYQPFIAADRDKVAIPMVQKLLDSAYNDQLVGALADGVTIGQLYNVQIGSAERAKVDARWLHACREQQSGPKLRRNLTVAVWNRLQTQELRLAFIDALRREDDADPYIVHHFLGRYYIQAAWQARGSGWANSVTPEGWKGFYANLKTARQHLTAAWKLDPSLPQPANDMITVAMGGGDQLNETPLDWLDKATKIQVDFGDAYGLARSALLPRWGGSLEQIFDLGQACLATGRFDTLLPLEYVKSIKTIEAESGADPLSIFGRDEVFGQVQRLFNAYAAANPSRAAYFHSSLAAVAFRVGQIKVARHALDAMANAKLQPDPLGFEMFQVTDVALATAEIYVRTGPLAAEVEDVVRDVERKDYEHALQHLAGLKSELKPSDPHYAFIRQLEKTVNQMGGIWTDLQLDPIPRERKDPSTNRWRGTFGTHHVRAREQSADKIRRGSLDKSEFPNAKPNLKLVVWDDAKCKITRTPNYEVEALVYFEDAHDPTNPYTQNLPAKGDSYTGGVGFYDQQSATCEFAVVDYGQQRAGFAVGGKVVVSWPVKVGSQTKLRVRVADRVATLFVDDHAVGEPHKLGEKFGTTCRLGVGGPDEYFFEYNDVRYRNLSDHEAAPPAPGAPPRATTLPATQKMRPSSPPPEK